MSTGIRIRPSRNNKSVEPRGGRARAQGGKERHVSAGRFSKSPGRNTAPTIETLFPVHIRALGVYLNQNARTSIRRKIDRKFGKFARSIERLSVRLEDVNGPRGGVDHACRIKVVLRNLPSVVYEKQDISLDTAFGGALVGAERAVRRTLQRIRVAPVRKRPRVARVPLTKSGEES